MWPVQSTIFWTDTGRWNPPANILSSGMSLIVTPSPWKRIPCMSSPSSNFSRWFLIFFPKHLLINSPHTVSLPVILKSLETFLAVLIIALNFSSSPILNLIPLLKMVIPINEASLASAAENIIPEVTEVTYTVDNIDNLTPWSLNVSVWCLFSRSYWSKRSNKI